MDMPRVVQWVKSCKIEIDSNRRTLGIEKHGPSADIVVTIELIMR